MIYRYYLSMVENLKHLNILHECLQMPICLQQFYSYACKLDPPGLMQWPKLLTLNISGCFELEEELPKYGNIKNIFGGVGNKRMCEVVEEHTGVGTADKASTAKF